MAYAANGVDFDGSNDWLNRGADLTSNANGKKFLFSGWFRLDGGDGAGQVIYENTGARISIRRHTDDKIRVISRNTSGTIILNCLSTGTYTTDATWRHLLVGVDLSVPEIFIYVDDVDDTGTPSVLTDDTIDFTRAEHVVGANTIGNVKFNGCFADIYFNSTSGDYLDFSTESNRRKFIDASGNVVDLGSDGSTPTGNQPIIFFSGTTTGWETNLGYGGGFTENGALTDCSDDPPFASGIQVFRRRIEGYT